MTDERINFERWLTATYKWADTDMNICGQYDDDHVHFMWEGWLAGQKCHAMIELPKHSATCEGTYDDCVAALREMGFKAKGYDD